ncbi:MAG TPA: DUF962 domain-containing protein [Fontimonas sp.]
MKDFSSFAEFYPFYLSQHSDRNCRRLHFVGTAGVIAALTVAAAALKPLLVLLAPLVGYGCAWIGHFGFERNKPAAFGHPLWSLRADFVMFWQILSGRIAL